MGMIPRNLTMIPVRENSEVVMKFTQKLVSFSMSTQGSEVHRDPSVQSTILDTAYTIIYLLY